MNISSLTVRRLHNFHSIRGLEAQRRFHVATRLTNWAQSPAESSKLASSDYSRLHSSNRPIKFGTGRNNWLGVSIYGTQEPNANERPSFKAQMEKAYNRLHTLTPEKPIMILELGVTMNDAMWQPDPSSRKLGGAAKWGDTALSEILTSAEWSERLRGLSWWN